MQVSSSDADSHDSGPKSQRPWLLRVYSHLTPQVLTAIVLGIALGVMKPDVAQHMKPLADMFVNLVKLVISPVVFLTVVLGVSSMGDMKRLGRVGGKALLYFELVTTFALAIGLVVVNVVKPGAGLDPAKLVSGDASKFFKDASERSTVEIVFPKSMVEPFVKNDTLHIVVIALLVGLALAGMGQAGRPVIELCERLCKMMFRIVGMVMRVAPLGAFGAMASVVGGAGIDALLPLAWLMGSVYLTMALFVFVVLNLICRLFGFRIWHFLKYIKEEILLVLGASSSEVALPRLMAKLERGGCSKSIVELVVPAGYSFNLDGTSIYLSMAAIFIAQVYSIELTIWEQLKILGLLMLTSKGAAGVTGSGFIVLASTIEGTRLPKEGLGLLLGVDRFMSEARSIVNLIGNGVATIVISITEREFNWDAWRQAQRADLDQFELKEVEPPSAAAPPADVVSTDGDASAAAASPVQAH